MNAAEFMKVKEFQSGQYSFSTTLAEIASVCHIRIDDAAFTLAELGFLQHRRPAKTANGRSKRKRLSKSLANGDGNHGEEADEDDEAVAVDYGEWKDVEVVITREMVDAAWKEWRVKEKGVLDESCVLL
jgi:histone acetyltransferase MYST1